MVALHLCRFTSDYCFLPLQRSTQVPRWFGQWTRTLRPYEWGSSWDSGEVEGCGPATGGGPRCTGWNCSHQPRRYQPLLQQCLHPVEESELNDTSLHLADSSASSGESNCWGEPTGKQDQEWTDWATTAVILNKWTSRLFTSHLILFAQVYLLWLFEIIIVMKSILQHKPIGNTTSTITTLAIGQKSGVIENCVTMQTLSLMTAHCCMGVGTIKTTVPIARTTYLINGEGATP